MKELESSLRSRNAAWNNSANRKARLFLNFDRSATPPAPAKVQITVLRDTRRYCFKTSSCLLYY